MPTVKINGVEVDVAPGTNMIEAAKQVGVEIPHYCYHPHLTVAGNCRMCLVDVEAGGRGPDIACNMQARDGLAIRTDTPQVEQMRKAVMEFLLKNHPLDCPICDQSGECRLQDYYMDYGAYDSRLADDKVTKGKREDVGEFIMLDRERCVACTRCVRFGDEVTGTGELRLFNRTDHTTIGIFPGETLRHHYQGCLADICPVGALTNKAFRFKKRVWYLKESPSVCDGCATGCNIYVCHQGQEVFRFLPRRNDHVNQSWMCDFGRLSYEELGGMKRLLGFRAGGAPVEADDAFTRAAGLLQGGTVGVVLGAKATNEANWALVQLAKRHCAEARFFLIEGNDPGAETASDELLLDADKNPNRMGAALAGASAGVAEGGEALKAAIAANEIHALLVLQDDALGRLEISGPSAIVYVGTWRGATARAASVVLPASAAAEQDGTFTNRSGRVQRLRRAYTSPGDAQPAYKIIDGVAQAMGGSVVPAMPAAIFKAYAASVPGMAGMTWKGLGDEGMEIAAPAPLAAETEAPAAPA